MISEFAIFHREVELTWWVLTVFMMVSFCLQMILYFAYTYLAYRFFWLSKNPMIQRRSIQGKAAVAADIRREVAYSVLTLLVFTVGWTGIVLAWRHGALPMFVPRFGAFGWGYTFLALLLSVLVHEVYFYGSHRLLHGKFLFRRIHYVHHLSINPTPFALFETHPLEAVILFGATALQVLLYPNDLSTMAAFSVISSLSNVYGHTGYEFAGRFFFKFNLDRVFATSTHHNRHHLLFRYNFGLSSSVFDRIFRTVDPGYSMECKKWEGRINRE